MDRSGQAFRTPSVGRTPGRGLPVSFFGVRSSCLEVSFSHPPFFSLLATILRAPGRWAVQSSVTHFSPFSAFLTLPAPVNSGLLNPRFFVRLRLAFLLAFCWLGHFLLWPFPAFLAIGIILDLSGESVVFHGTCCGFSCTFVSVQILWPVSFPSPEFVFFCSGFSFTQ